jgi:outer membrane autotransporter protein
MRFSHPQLRPLPLVLALQAIFTLPAHAVAAPDVTVLAGETLGVQTLAGNSATIQQGGTLTGTGTTAAATVTAGTSTITNSGKITQTGTGNAIDANAASTILTINNNAGAVIDAAGNVTIRINKATDGFIINNQGAITQSSAVIDGKQYAIKTNVDFSTINNQIINGSVSNTSATISSTSSSAIKMGSNTTLTNYGQIYSTSPVNTKCADYIVACATGTPPKAADGISVDDAMRNAVILNYGSITGQRHGIDGGNPVAANADSDLIGVDRLIVVTTGPNGVTFDKVVGGVTTSNVKIDNPVVINYAGGNITGNNGSGVGFDGHGVVINYGTISGNYAGAGKVYDHKGLGLTTSNGDGDGVDIDGVAYVENYGRIQGTGAGGLDSGGNPNGADGIAAGGGSIINHAGAVIYGQSKGILIDDGADGTAVVSGRGTSLANGSTITIVNEGTITGEKKVAVGLVGNFNDTLTNAASGVITGGTDAMRLGENNSTVAGAAVQMGAGDDTLINYGRIEGKNGLAIDMGTGNDTLRLLGGSIIGAIDGGTGTNTLETNGTQIFADGNLRNFQTITVLGGNLRVNGSFATNNLTVNGTLQAPDSGAFRTISIAGNYVQGASGVLETRIGASNASDSIAVTGTATLTNGATIRPLISGAVADGSTYTLISAATLSASAANLSIDGGSGAFYSYSLQGSGNNLQLVAHQKNGIAAVAPQRFENLANALSVAATNGFTTSQQGLNLLNALQALPTAQALSDATSQLSPETNAAAQSAASAAQGSVFSAFDNRIDTVRSGGPLAMTKTGLDGGDSVGNRFWLQGLAAIASQDARKGANGYDLDAQGLAVGYEMDLNARDMVGFSGGYTQAASDGKDSGAGDDTDVKSIHIGAYFSRTDASYTLDAGVAVSANRYSSQRVVTIPGFTETLSGDYSGYQIGARAEYGIPFALNEKWSGRWLMGARFAYLDNGAYSETGGASAQNVASTSANSAQSVLGVEFVNKLSAASSATLRARYLHEFSDTPAVNASFATGGPSFTVDGVQPGRDALQLGFGYRNITSQGTTIAIGYDMEIKDEYLGHQLTAKAIWNF